MRIDCCVKMNLTQCERDRERERQSQLKTSIFLITWRQFSIWIVAVTHIKPPASGFLRCHHLSPAFIWTFSHSNFMPLASSTIISLSVNVLQIAALVWKILMWRILFSVVSISLWILHLSQKKKKNLQLYKNKKNLLPRAVLDGGCEGRWWHFRSLMTPDSWVLFLQISPKQSNSPSLKAAALVRTQCFMFFH